MYYILAVCSRSTARRIHVHAIPDFSGSNDFFMSTSFPVEIFGRNARLGKVERVSREIANNINTVFRKLDKH